MALIDGRYEVVKGLGAGSMGEALLARDRDGRQVVVKLLHKKYTESEKSLERFRREIRALEKLRHPNIMALLGHGFCAERAQPYYVMEFLDGTTLNVIAASQILSMARVMRLTSHILDGLAFAHEAKVIHRDLKPSNLFVELPGTLDESVRIFDFGLAKHYSGKDTAKPITAPGQILGTPCYMAPEQLLGDPPVPETDIYAMGCILMELLTGAPPFPESSLQRVIKLHLDVRPPRIEDRRDAPKELGDLLDECLAKDPRRRPRASALKERLSQIRTRFEASTARVGLHPTGDGPARPASSITDVPTHFASRASDAIRAKLEIVHDEDRERVFLFAGSRLRFGRASEKDAKTTDLVLRAFPRRRGSADTAKRRSLDVSRWHGTFLATERGISVRDESSTAGTMLDGRVLTAGQLVPLPEKFTLEVGGAIVLEGRLLRARGPFVPELSATGFDRNPVAGLVLERKKDSCEDRYVFMLRELSLGSGVDDDIPIDHPGVKRAHARIVVNRGRFLIAAGGIVRMERPLPMDAYVPLEPGKHVRLGAVDLAFSEVADDDMKPPRGEGK